MSEVIKAYKGFKKDMTCRGFQYEEGKEYETDKAKACECGFHACEMPLDTFKYYKPAESEYHEVEQSGEFSKDSDDSKVASTKIKIGAKIGIESLVKAQIEFIFNKVKWKDVDNETSGYKSTAASSGDWSTAASSGDWSTAASSGYKSTAASSGNGSTAASSGEESTAASSNQNAIAVACGKNAKAKGVIGSYIVLTEWNETADTLISAQMVRIDGEKYKPDTWYRIENGEIIEAQE